VVPTDEDVLVNLKLENLKIIDKTAANGNLFFKSWWTKFVSSKSAGAWGAAYTCILIYFFCFSNCFPISRFFFFETAVIHCFFTYIYCCWGFSF
jgi:hypothetical protein